MLALDEFLSVKELTKYNFFYTIANVEFVFTYDFFLRLINFKDLKGSIWPEVYYEWNTVPVTLLQKSCIEHGPVTNVTTIWEVITCSTSGVTVRPVELITVEVLITKLASRGSVEIIVIDSKDVLFSLRLY